MRKDQTKNIVKIVNCLKQAEDWVWIRLIARRTGLHHKTVARLIDKNLSMFVDIQSMEPFNIRMVKLKPGTDVNGIYRYLSVMEKLNKTPKTSPILKKK